MNNKPTRRSLQDSSTLRSQIYCAQFQKQALQLPPTTTTDDDSLETEESEPSPSPPPKPESEE